MNITLYPAHAINVRLKLVVRKLGDIRLTCGSFNEQNPGQEKGVTKTCPGSIIR